MIIEQETINTLKAQGITIKWYEDATFEDFSARLWLKDVNESIDYHKANVRGSEETEKGYTNVLFETYEDLKKWAERTATSFNRRHCDPYEYDKLYIIYDNGAKTIIKKESVKSRVIDVDYVLRLVEKNEKAYKGAYGHFALKMQELLKRNDLNNIFSVYPTTYGIGVWVMYYGITGKRIEKVRAILNEKGIEYENEFSDAHWVYRFKVSKKASNLAKINN